MPQHPTTFGVEPGEDGLFYVTVDSKIFGRERVGGRFLPQYVHRDEVSARQQAVELQRDYDEHAA